MLAHSVGIMDPSLEVGAVDSVWCYKKRVYCMYDAVLEGQTSDLTTCLVNAPPSRTLQTKLTFMTTKKETKYYMNVVFKVLSEISS